jgi:hypothetical protein
MAVAYPPARSTSSLKNRAKMRAKSIRLHSNARHLVSIDACLRTIVRLAETGTARTNVCKQASIARQFMLFLLK